MSTVVSGDFTLSTLGAQLYIGQASYASVRFLHSKQASAFYRPSTAIKVIAWY
jgi:hypothetical protein